MCVETDEKKNVTNIYQGIFNILSLPLSLLRSSSIITLGCAVSVCVCACCVCAALSFTLRQVDKNLQAFDVCVCV